MIDKQPARIAGMFEAIAARYDLLNHLLSAGCDRRWRRAAVRSLGLDERSLLLDLCTGTGDVALTAVRAASGRLRVLGVDFSAEMLRRGHVKIGASGVAGRVHFVRGDATRLGVASGAVDAVTVAFGIRNVDRPERALAEIRRVLRPGGRLAILEFSLPRHPVVRACYLLYFRHVLPRIGRLVSGHTTAYTYLPVSVGTFIPPAVLIDLLETTGFCQVRARPLTLGVVTLYEATA